MSADQLIAACLLGAGFLFVLPWLLVGVARRDEPKGKVSPGWMVDQRRRR